MSTMKRHIGRIKNTDRRCVVVYMQIPGKPDHALIVDTDALPDRFHDAVMNIVDSLEGQKETTLANVLARRIMPDYNTDVMNVLHTSGALQAVHIDNIVMYPLPNNPYPLRNIVEAMKVAQDPVQSRNPEAIERVNRIAENQAIDRSESQVNLARNLLQEASMLFAEAEAKRDAAYRLAPVLRPSAIRAEEVAAAPVSSPSSFETARVNYEYTEQDRIRDQVAATRLAEYSANLKKPVEIAPVVNVANPADLVDLPPDIAAIYLNEVQNFVPEQFEEVPEEFRNEVIAEEQVPDRVQEMLDRAAYREDVETKNLEPVVKRPVGRPKKNATA